MLKKTVLLVIVFTTSVATILSVGLALSKAYNNRELSAFINDETSLPNPGPTNNTETVAGKLEPIAQADLNRNGMEDTIYLDKSRMETDCDVTLRIHDCSGAEIWSAAANTAHSGWDSLFLYKQDGEQFLLRYNPSMYQGFCAYTYILFTLENSTETVILSNRLDFDINGTKALDASKMVAFAEEINALLGKSILLMSTEGGEYSFGPSSADQFLESYSWLDAMPELYADNDDLETRINKYSNYAILNRQNSATP